MAKAFRYALATFCFAASVGFLALWWRSKSITDIAGGSIGRIADFEIEIYSGRCEVGLFELRQEEWKHLAFANHGDFHRVTPPQFGASASTFAGGTANFVWFPLWYPALIFALAGVGVLRFRRQFSIRSALVVVSVVAALLGMAVVL